MHTILDKIPCCHETKVGGLYAKDVTLTELKKVQDALANDPSNLAAVLLHLACDEDGNQFDDLLTEEACRDVPVFKAKQIAEAVLEVYANAGKQ